MTQPRTHRLKDLPIGQKLNLVVLLPSAAALLFTATVLIGSAYLAGRQALVADLSSMARILGENSRSAVVFDDTEFAREALATLNAHSHVVSACLFTPDGEVFAQYQRDAGTAPALRTPPPHASHCFGDGHLLVSQPIFLEDEIIGQVCIQSDMSEMWRRLRGYASVVIPVVLASFCLVYVLQKRLRLTITRPVGRLAEVVREVSEKKDYALRVDLPHAEDEIGLLVTQFNEMLARIQEHEAALSDARNRLEERVAERTSALRQQVAERERAQRALRESEQKYRELVESANSIILRMTPAGYVTFINEYAQRFFGYTEEEILGRNVVGTIMPAEETEGRAPLKLFHHMGKTPRQFALYENENVKRNGERVCVAWANRAIENPKGDVTELLCVGTDITERRRAEEALRAAKDRTDQTNHELEEAIDRANRLAEAAQRATEAKSEFVANMSHEIRTPMNAIIGMTGLLLDTELNEEQRDFAETVRASADGLLALINDILDLSKIEAGKLELECKDFNLKQVIDDLLDITAVRSEQKGLALNAVVARDVPALVRGDPVRLRQILINLVDNAVKFTKQGEVLVEVAVQERGLNRVRLGFSVKDTGVGISRDRQNRLFKAFSQAELSTTREYGGTGLGLAISRQLATLMRGGITVESDEGHGATFTVSVQLEVQPEQDTSSVEDLDGTSLLIMDDRLNVRRALGEHLAVLGCAVSEAQSMEEGCAALEGAISQSHPFDFVLIRASEECRQMKDMGAFNVPGSCFAQSKVIAIMTPAHRACCHDLRGQGLAGCLIEPVRYGPLVESLLSSRKAGQVTPEGAEAGPGTGGDSQQAVQSPHILLVEDNPVNQKVAIRILERLGCEADFVGNGSDAVEALKSGQYDLVLMDVQMPVMDGLEATRRIRKNERGAASHIPIIAMTAHAMRSDQERCIEAGMDDFLPKPVRREDLHSKLMSFLGPLPEPAMGKLKSRATAPREKALDADKLLHRLDGDEELFVEVLKLFVDDFPGHIQRLHEEHTSGDVELLMRSAHTMRGSAANVGAERLSMLLQDLERAAHNGESASVETLIGKVEQEFQQVVEEVAAY